MRQLHLSVDKVFVHYSGKTVPILDRETDEVRSAQLFIAVLGASNYTYAVVSSTRALPDWISARVQVTDRLRGPHGQATARSEPQPIQRRGRQAPVTRALMRETG
jgi:transposase